MDKLPILNEACSLSDDEFAARLDVLRREFLPHVLSRRAFDDGQVFEFDLSMKDQLETLVAFERQCCPDVHWRLGREGDRMHLEIRGLGEDILVD